MLVVPRSNCAGDWLSWGTFSLIYLGLDLDLKHVKNLAYLGDSLMNEYKRGLLGF